MSSKIKGTKEMIAQLFESGDVTGNTVKEFQTELWDNLLFFRQSLNILDIHKIPRYTVIQQINDSLMERTKTLIEMRAEKNDKKAQKTWSQLMKSGYQYIYHPYMRPRVMQVLGKMSVIKERFLSPISQDPDLYADAPIEVLRHIWLENSESFRDEVVKVLKRYVESISSQLLEPEAGPFLYLAPKRRRKHPCVEKLVNMIGDKPELYEKTLTHIRSFYSNREEKNVCPLRSELILSLNEHKMESVCLLDPLHKFAWCLDACVRDRRIDAKHAHELSVFYQDLDLEVDKNVIDLQMLCRDPYAVHTLCNSIIRNVINAAGDDKIPREVQTLSFLQHLLIQGVEPEVPCVPLTDTLAPLDDSSFASPPPRKAGRQSKSSRMRLDNFGEEPTSLEALMTARILPALLQLHLSAWQTQVNTEIASAKLRAENDPNTRVASSTSQASSTEASSSSSTTNKEPSTRHHNLYLLLSDVTTEVRVPMSYLCHPLGTLLAQYHCLLLLEREDWVVLKALIGGLTKVKDQVDWRFECLQALILGSGGISQESVRVELLTLLRDLIPLDSVMHLTLFAHTALLLPSHSAHQADRESALASLQTALTSLNLTTVPPQLSAFMDTLKKMTTVTPPSTPPTPRSYTLATPSRLMMAGSATPAVHQGGFGFHSRTPVRFALPPGTPFHNPGIPATPMHTPMTPLHQPSMMLPPPSPGNAQRPSTPHSATSSASPFFYTPPTTTSK